jgi:hypothetical protein
MGYGCTETVYYTLKQIDTSLLISAENWPTNVHFQRKRKPIPGINNGNANVRLDSHDNACGPGPQSQHPRKKGKGHQPLNQTDA